MKLILDNIILRPSDDEKQIPDIIARRFAIVPPAEYTILRKSLDARKKGNIIYRYRIVIDVPDDRGESLLRERDVAVFSPPAFPAVVRRMTPEKILVVGSGPAGLFCALRLIASGARAEIIERGRPVNERMRDIELLERRGVLHEESNVLFGEGGAGTYSDGKLTTRTRRPEIDWLFKKLVEFGAPSSILYDAKPHIGTDLLRGIIQNIRAGIIAAGSEIRFSETVNDFIIREGRFAGLMTRSGGEYRGSRLILAAGHSARDLYAMLARRGIMLVPKGFAAGVRIEHPAEHIDSIQYGNSPDRGALPAAEYSITYRNRMTGRSVYSFCMCPGGRVINSSSEQGGLCTNGMSFSGRALPFSNSALVVTVSPTDLPDGPLGGIELQRRIEEKAFTAGGGSFIAPAQRVMSFMENRIDDDLPQVSYRPGARPADLRKLLPEWIVSELVNGFHYFNKIMKGFISTDAVLIGVETRTSSPVRVVRSDDFQSVSVKGLYPVGEGSGYAGGIVSSAVDGIRCADHIILQNADG